MMANVSKRAVMSILALAAVVATATEPQSGAPAATLARVEARFVCMVNDRRFNAPQIPIVVGSRTYYGCCEGCKGRLSQDATVRVAKDPVSGVTVDKATAIAGASADGTVVYFENVANFEAFGRR